MRLHVTMRRTVRTVRLVSLAKWLRLARSARLARPVTLGKSVLHLATLVFPAVQIAAQTVHHDLQERDLAVAGQSSASS